MKQLEDSNLTKIHINVDSSANGG